MSMDKRAKDFSNTVYVFRVFALLSAMSSHVLLFAGDMAKDVWMLFTTFGVPGFFICSGYFFNNRTPFKVMWKRKLKSIIVPWVVVASITYGVSWLMAGRMRYSYLEWVTGSRSLYFFVPVLLLCFLIFYFLRQNLSLVLIMLLGLASFYLTAAGVINLTGFIHDGLNVFNWVFFFGLGALLRKNRQAVKTENLAYSSYGWILLALFVSVAISLVYIRFFDVSYWTYLSVPYELAAVLSFFMLSSKLKDLHLLANMGNNTYTVYLFHVPLASRINRGIQLPNALYFIKPLLVLIICYALVFAAIFVARKMKIGKFLWIVGIRTDH
jgi:fucose 4-O-acetylase-like acetyltransferase